TRLKEAEFTGKIVSPQEDFSSPRGKRRIVRRAKNKRPKDPLSMWVFVYFGFWGVYLMTNFEAGVCGGPKTASTALGSISIFIVFIAFSTSIKTNLFWAFSVSICCFDNVPFLPTS